MTKTCTNCQKPFKAPDFLRGRPPKHCKRPVCMKERAALKARLQYEGKKRARGTVEDWIWPEPWTGSL